MRFACLLLALMISVPTFALKQVLFGPEFTFSPSRAGLSTRAVWERMEKHLIKDQPEGAKFRLGALNGREYLTSPNGWWVSWYWDLGSVEVQTRPMTVAEFKRFRDDMHDAIFVSAANEGYFPELWRGGGHINLNVANFQENTLLYRNFIIDLLNHNELFMGIFNYDVSNATPHELVHVFHPTSRLRSDVPALLEVLDGRLQGGASFESMTSLFKEYLKGFSFWFFKIEQQRIEIRAVRPQASIDVWIHQIELIEARLKYLENIKTPIPYQPRVAMDAEPRDRLTPPVDPQEAMKSFYVYVRESGLPWKDHRDYLWPQWMWRQNENEPSELEKFESSEWFLNQEASVSCERHLGVGT